MPGLLLLFLPAFVGGLVVAPVALLPSGVVGVTKSNARLSVPVVLAHVFGSAVL